MEEQKSYKLATISGLIYRFMERILAQLISTVVTIVLARILMPEEYGIVSIVTIIITFCNILVSNGIGSALIQKKDSDELDFSTMFWFSLVLSIIFYFVIFFSAPYVAKFYNMPILTDVIRVMGFRVPLAAINSVQSAHVSKNLLFKNFFWATLGGTLVSGCVGICMAYAGFGVWSLIFQYLTNTFIDTVFIFFLVGWKPKFQYSWARFKDLFSFGWKVLVSGIVAEIYESLSSLVIAKKYTVADLSYYSKGRQFPQLIGNNVSTTITNVLFPIFSKYQSNKAQLKNVVARSIKVGMYIISPAMIGFLVVSDTFISLVLTDKWLFAVPYSKIFCLIYILKPLKNINKSAMKALKRSDLDLYVNVTQKIIGIILIIVSLNLGTIYLAWSMFVSYLVAIILNGIIIGRLLDYTLTEQLKDVISYPILAFVACIPSYALTFFDMNLLLRLIIQVALGGVSYCGLSMIFRVESFYYIWDIINKSFLKKLKENSK